MKPEPTVSIIVSAYNVESYIQQCMDSILKQTYPNIEVICVDDGSTDASGEIIDQYAKADARILTIHVPNSGVASARNAALSYGW